MKIKITNEEFETHIPSREAKDFIRELFKELTENSDLDWSDFKERGQGGKGKFLITKLLCFVYDMGTVNGIEKCNEGLKDILFSFFARESEGALRDSL